MRSQEVRKMNSDNGRGVRILSAFYTSHKLFGEGDLVERWARANQQNTWNELALQLGQRVIRNDLFLTKLCKRGSPEAVLVDWFA
jgi:hypothetical protein